MPFTDHIHVKGKISELKVQAYFLSEGYEVFNPVSDKTRADMLLLDRETNEVLKVQVKTVQRNTEYLQCRITVKERHYTSEEVDLFVFVYEERMWVVPQEVLKGRSTANFGRVDQRSKVERPDALSLENFEIH